MTKKFRLNTRKGVLSFTVGLQTCFQVNKYKTCPDTQDKRAYANGRIIGWLLLPATLICSNYLENIFLALKKNPMPSFV